MSKLIKARSDADPATDAAGAATPTAPKLNLAVEVEHHDQGFSGMDIQLRAFWRSMEYVERWKSGRVLLTGSTGFLGAFLLRDLLTETNAHIFCVVREGPETPGMDRVRETLNQYGILPLDTRGATDKHILLESKVNQRVSTIKGDVGLVNMGMTKD